MHPNSQVRRVHSAQLKSAVLVACNEPGASIAAVALAHGLNANLVRKWRMGRGLQRCGFVPSAAPQTTTPAMAAQSLSPPASPTPPPPPSPSPSPLLAGNARFLPIDTAAPPTSLASQAPPALSVGVASPCVTTQPEPAMHIELKRGPVSLSVRWPASAGGDCAAWLRELTSGLLK